MRYALWAVPFSALGCALQLVPCSVHIRADGNSAFLLFWNTLNMFYFYSLPQTIEFDEGAGAVLRIQPLRTPRDENVYECIAQNSVAESTVNAKLTVLRGKIWHLARLGFSRGDWDSDPKCTSLAVSVRRTSTAFGKIGPACSGAVYLCILDAWAQKGRHIVLMTCLWQKEWHKYSVVKQMDCLIYFYQG